MGQFSALSADRNLGLEPGADDYVAKPCTSRELLARIRAFNLPDSGLCVEILLPGYSARESSFLAASAGIGLPK